MFFESVVNMKKFLVFIAFTGFLSSGVDSFKISEKEYENIDRVLEFGVQVFLNCLDKLKEATEKTVKDDMLRTNRIAVQDSWNSFKETTNRISNEERGKGVQDDLIVAARIIRRVVLNYKDDVKKMFHTIATEQNVQLYLPILNTFKGSFNKAKAKEIWSTLVAQYFPDAPPAESDPLEVLCYLLSTKAVETYFVNVLKIGAELTAEYKKIDFDQVTKRVWEKYNEVFNKINELYEIEKEKEKDDFLVLVSASSRAFVFYWDRFLNATDTPLLQEKFEAVEEQLKNQNIDEQLKELIKPIMELETLNEVMRRHEQFFLEFYYIGLSPLIVLYFSGPERFLRTARTVFMEIVVQSYSIYEKLSDMGVFSEMKRQYFRGLHIITALLGTEEVQYFKNTCFEKWMAFTEELNVLVEMERRKTHIIFPQMRAVGQMLLQKFEAFLDRVNADVDDDTVEYLSMNWAKIRAICISKLLASGVLTQDQLDEAQSIFQKDVFGLYQKYEELTKEMDPKRAEEILKGLVKLLMVGLNYIYAPLTQAWDFVAA